MNLARDSAAVAALYRDVAVMRRILTRREVAIHERAHARLVEIVRALRPPPGLFVEVGAGEGALVSEAAAAGYRAIGVDLFPEGTDGIAAVDVSLPLREGTCDAVVFCASLHYSADTLSTLSETRRVLRNGGVVAISMTPVHETARAAERAADTTRRRLERAGGNGPLTKRYSHLTTRGLESAIAASGFGEIERLDAGLGDGFRVARAVKRMLTRGPYAEFPLYVGRAG